MINNITSNPLCFKNQSLDFDSQSRLGISAKRQKAVCDLKQNQYNLKHENRSINAVNFRANFVPFMGAKVVPQTFLHSFEDFSKRFEALGLSPFEFIKEVSNIRNIIGDGNHGKVFKIPKKFNLNEYVVKVQDSGSFQTRCDLHYPFLPVQDLLPGINLGQPVARDEEQLILKKVDGVVIVPSQFSDSSIYERRDIFLTSFKLASNMPQKAFDNLIMETHFLQKHGVKFDSAGLGNILLDAKHNAFHHIDVDIFNKPDLEYSYSFQDMLTQFDGDSLYLFNRDEDVQKEFNRCRKMIIYKLITAYNNSQQKNIIDSLLLSYPKLKCGVNFEKVAEAFKSPSGVINRELTQQKLDSLFGIKSKH